MSKVQGKSRYIMHPLFEITLEDIFNKHDMFMNKVLGYEDMYSLFQTIGKTLTSDDFNNFLNKFQSAPIDYRINNSN